MLDFEIAGAAGLRVFTSGPEGTRAVQNFRLDDFLFANRKLAEYREILRQNADKTVGQVSVDSIKALDWLRDELWKLGLGAYTHIEKALDAMAQPGAHYSVIIHRLDEAVNSIDEQIRTEWTYHYGDATTNISNYQFRWHRVLKAFPSTEFEISSALDLYSLQHFTAAVFHFMRLAEYGLRALATELSVTLPKGKPLTHANWQDIIGHCDKKVKEITATAPAGDAKDAALVFYSGALAHLHFLKNNFRNEVMHARSQFDMEQAHKASHAAKDLMELLATRLSERTKKKGFKNGKIDWGF